MNTLNLVYVIRSIKRRWVKETFTLFTNPVDQAAEQFRNTMPQWQNKVRSPLTSITTSLTRAAYSR